MDGEQVRGKYENNGVITGRFGKGLSALIERMRADIQAAGGDALPADEKQQLRSRFQYAAVYQDGGRFYASGMGVEPDRELVSFDHLVLHDHDTLGAQQARREFEKWAAKQPLLYWDWEI